MKSRSGAKLGSLCALVVVLGSAFACAVEENLPIGDWLEPGGEGGAGGRVGSGGSATAGTGSPAGNAGSAGSLSVGCDYVPALSRSCAIAGCHNSRLLVAGLDLTPNPPENLIARLKDKPAGHADIDCGDGRNFVPCVPATCPPPGTALLVDSANPDDSWILRKLNGTHDDCGNQMPMAPGDRDFDAATKACVEDLVRAIAAAGAGAG